MYSVYRYNGGLRDLVARDIKTFAEANQLAVGLQQKETHRKVEYRVQGPGTMPPPAPRAPSSTAHISGTETGRTPQRKRVSTRRSTRASAPTPPSPDDSQSRKERSGGLREWIKQLFAGFERQPAASSRAATSHISRATPKPRSQPGESTTNRTARDNRPLSGASAARRGTDQSVPSSTAGITASAGSSRRSSPESGTPQRNAAAPGSPRRITTPERSAPQHYTVVRVENERRFGVKGTFHSLDEACDHALALQQQCHTPGATFEVEYQLPRERSTPKQPQRQPAQPKPASAQAKRPQRRRASSLPGQQKRQSRHHDWEIEDRRSDIALAYREEEELGLGIPAQWGKGRRSRKGDYIP